MQIFISTTSLGQIHKKEKKTDLHEVIKIITKGKMGNNKTVSNAKLQKEVDPCWRKLGHNLQRPGLI